MTQPYAFLRVCLSETFTEAPLVCFQLFRRVAAALPGMDSTPEKSKEDSILFTKLSQRSFVARTQCSRWYQVTVTTDGAADKSGAYMYKFNGEDA